MPSGILINMPSTIKSQLYSKGLYDSLADINGYHSKAHGDTVAETAAEIIHDVNIKSRQKDVIIEAGRWHDVGCLLGQELMDHDGIGLKYIRDVVAKKNSTHKKFFNEIADVIEATLDVQLGNFKVSDTTSSGAMVEAADLIAQFGSPCYIPMLRNLYRLFFNDKRAYGHKNNPFCSIDALFYDDYIYKHTEAFLKYYLDLPLMAERKLVFYANKQIREISRRKEITYEDVIESFKLVSGLKYSEPSWSLDFSPEDVLMVESILEKV